MGKPTLTELNIKIATYRAAVSFYDLAALVFATLNTEDGNKAAQRYRILANDTRKACEAYQYELVGLPLPGQKKKRKKA